MVLVLVQSTFEIVKPIFKAVNLVFETLDKIFVMSCTACCGSVGSIGVNAMIIVSRVLLRPSSIVDV